MILNERIAEGLLRFELLKTNPDLLAKFDEETRRQEDAHYLSLLGPEGSIQRLENGGMGLYSPKFAPRTKPVSTQQNITPVTRTTKPQPPPTPSDYGKLLIANSRRQSSFIASKGWHEKRQELCRFIERNNRPQVA